ncbi:MAG: radical SAM protein [Candidatus Humimicrobiaceae bacterium]
MNQTDKNYRPHIIAFEITRSCEFNCNHCRAAASFGPYQDELSTKEIFLILDNIARFSRPIIIITGGDPMMRADVFEIAEYGTKLGLRMVMALCGKPLTDKIVKKIIKSGIQRISISIDGASAESHDAFRRTHGAFEGALQAIETAKRNGLKFQVNTTVTKQNVHELANILNLSIELGAVSFSPFLLVPTGRGKELKEQVISPEEYERVLNWIYDQHNISPIQFKPTCAPHYYRIFQQRKIEKGITVTTQINPLDKMSKGCIGGQSFAFISHIGKIQICGFLDIECGDIRMADYDFEHIWNTSNVFLQIRDLEHYHGRCGYCEYRKICGGCRARAFASTGNYLSEEPYCVYQPKTKPHNLFKKYITDNFEI